jgi:hydrogenase maturation protein HypF
VLRTDLGSYDRVAHLQPVPLLGGEKAVRDPRRLVFAMDEMAGRPGEHFTDGEAAVLRKIMGTSGTTTGFGRLLDALSCHLEVCQRRTCDGEPAMKLEAVLERGRVLEGLNAERRNGVVMTVPLFQQLRELRGSPADLALTYVDAVLESLIEAAADEASNKGLEVIGLTGGVSYNGVVSSLTESKVRARGLKFVCPDRLPNGDGGISSGQCAIALYKIA